MYNAQIVFIEANANATIKAIIDNFAMPVTIKVPLCFLTKMPT